MQELSDPNELLALGFQDAENMARENIAMANNRSRGQASESPPDHGRSTERSPDEFGGLPAIEDGIDAAQLESATEAAKDKAAIKLKADTAARLAIQDIPKAGAENDTLGASDQDEDKEDDY